MEDLVKCIVIKKNGVVSFYFFQLKKIYMYNFVGRPATNGETEANN